MSAAISRAALPKTDDANDPVQAGREAWRRLKAQERKSWDDWKLIGAALLIGRKQAMDKAHTNKPSGKTYNTHFHHWLEMNQFDDIDNSDRAHLLEIMEKLPEVEARRAAWTLTDRLRWNSPSTVWRVWKCKRRARAFARQQGTNAAPRPAVNNAQTEEAAADDKGEKLLRDMLVAANRIGGKAQDFLAFTGEVDKALVAAVEAAAAAWAVTAADFRQRLLQQQQKAKAA
jgi:hypothetical protein